MILHVDMDAFYASVEERERPELRGRPVIVGGTPQGRGVVAAANYAARAHGVHSAMPAAIARRLCPDGVFLRPRMALYADVSRSIRAIFYRYTPQVEPLALDEAFLDVGASEKLFGSAEQIARRIKREIRDELGLVASVGVAPTKFVAKLASDLRKPDGFVSVAAGEVQALLDGLPVARLWGVGDVASEVFRGLGIATLGDLRRSDPALLAPHFGRHGRHLWQLAHGIDERPVVSEREAKSISHETTFARDIGDRDVLRAWLQQLTEQVAWRLRRSGARARTVHIKVRFADFKTITRVRTFAAATALGRELWQAAARLLAASLEGRRLGIRLLGVGVSGLEAPAWEQQDLFAAGQRRKQAGIDELLDSVRERFGATALRRGRRPAGAE